MERSKFIKKIVSASQLGTSEIRAGLCRLPYNPLEEYKQSHMYNMYSKLANLGCNLHCVDS